jgi:hypothetical protein
MKPTEKIRALFAVPVRWHEVESGGNEFMSVVNGQTCKLRINDFPDEPLYTLTIDGEHYDFDDKPSTWIIPFKK